MLIKSEEVRQLVQRLRKDHRIVMVACHRYCHYDEATEMSVDVEHTSRAALHRFAESAARQLITGEFSQHDAITDAGLELVQNNPWGVFIACQYRDGHPVWVAFMPARQSQLLEYDKHDFQIGDWPELSTIKGDCLISLFECVDRQVPRLDVGATASQDRDA